MWFRKFCKATQFRSLIGLGTWVRKERVVGKTFVLIAHFHTPQYLSVLWSSSYNLQKKGKMKINIEAQCGSLHCPHRNKCAMGILTLLSPNMQRAQKYLRSNTFFLTMFTQYWHNWPNFQKCWNQKSDYLCVSRKKSEFSTGNHVSLCHYSNKDILFDFVNYFSIIENIYFLYDLFPIPKLTTKETFCTAFKISALEFVNKVTNLCG